MTSSCNVWSSLQCWYCTASFMFLMWIYQAEFTDCHILLPPWCYIYSFILCRHMILMVIALCWSFRCVMMMSSNGNIFHVTGHLCGEFTGPGFPTQRPVTRSFDVFFDRCLNKWLSKQSWGWWFETPSCPLWRCRNVSQDPVWLKI